GFTARPFRRCAFTTRPTAHTAPGFRSIQMVMRSSLPPSSTPWSSRSANLPRSEGPGTARLYNPSRGGAIRELHPESILVPLHAVVRRGAGRRLPHARAPTRPTRRGDPAGPLRAEPPERAAHRRGARSDALALARLLDEADGAARLHHRPRDLVHRADPFPPSRLGEI